VFNRSIGKLFNFAKTFELGFPALSVGNNIHTGSFVKSRSTARLLQICVFREFVWFWIVVFRLVLSLTAFPRIFKKDQSLRSITLPESKSFGVCNKILQRNISAWGARSLRCKKNWLLYNTSKKKGLFSK
jgi:hypothetical protein